MVCKLSTVYFKGQDRQFAGTSPTKTTPFCFVLVDTSLSSLPPKIYRILSHTRVTRLTTTTADTIVVRFVVALALLYPHIVLS
jgi:hypothetical protein